MKLIHKTGIIIGLSLMIVLPVWADAPALSADQQTVVEGSNQFALDLYGQLRSQPGNLFFSPASISTALAMTYAGARGETADEMAKTVHFTLPQEKLHPAMGALLHALNDNKGDYELHEANALWLQKDYAFSPDFLSLTQANYDAGLNTLDFAHTKVATDTINSWVEKQTNDKITDLIAPGILSPDTRLVLTNAIYFKGDWQSQFKKELTKNGDFHVTPQKTVSVPLMHQVEDFKYAETQGTQILEMPYKGNDLSMIVLLPKTGTDLNAFEPFLDQKNIQQNLGLLTGKTKIDLALPKFKVTFQFNANDVLEAMGMMQAFGAADFSGMDGKKDIHISDVIHKAYIAVDEQGSEAAAATAIIVTTTAIHSTPKIIPFHADHPFIYLIRDNRSGSILFMGRMMDPS